MVAPTALEIFSRSPTTSTGRSRPCIPSALRWWGGDANGICDEDQKSDVAKSDGCRAPMPDFFVQLTSKAGVIYPDSRSSFGGMPASGLVRQ